jgi:hypothetical protein
MSPNKTPVKGEVGGRDGPISLTLLLLLISQTLSSKGLIDEQSYFVS